MELNNIKPLNLLLLIKGTNNHIKGFKHFIKFIQLHFEKLKIFARGEN